MPSEAQFRTHYGPYALVAGAAVGLGAEYARQIAARGLDVVLLDFNADPLHATTEEIRSRYGVQVRSIKINLARPDLTDQLQPQLADVEIGLLVYNAARGMIAPFLDLSPDACDMMMDVNCRGLLRLAHLLVPPMVHRRRGGLIVMSAISGSIGSTQMAVYAATKAFGLVFADALWAELRPHGIDVLAVQPGSTRTPGFDSSHQSQPDEIPPMDPADVVREALAALGVQPNIVPGERFREMAEMLARVPRREAIEIVSAITGRLRRDS